MGWGLMALLNICIYPDNVLRQQAADVDKIDGGIRRLIDDMAETMYEAPGIGLAANQVGKALRLLLIDLQRPEEEHGLIVLVNPVLVTGRGELVYEEGCLSLPGYFNKVKRFEEVLVRAQNQDGKLIEISASGLLAVALQHEMDHLDGKLFIDRLGPIARDLFKRRWKKRMMQEAG